MSVERELLADPYDTLGLTDLPQQEEQHLTWV